MKLILSYIVFILYTTPVISQNPQFSWGERINRKFGQLENMEIIGVDQDGFFATYAVNDQITLEHYNPQNERFWTVALLPKTPDGRKCSFHCVIMFRNNLYMLSSHHTAGKTNVYIQEITHNGNYNSDILLVMEDADGDNMKVAIAPNDAFLAIAVGGDDKQVFTLLSQELRPLWSQTVESEGSIEELMLQHDGTSYMLVKAPAAAPATNAYYLYQFNRQTGKNSRLTMGHTDYRPIRAKMALATNGSMLVSGYVAPSNTVASHNPEPVGTFLYRVNKYNLRRSTENYAPFSEEFISNYKRLKPDNDNSQRLRHLSLDHILPLPDGSLYLLGEVCIKENGAGTYTYHNNDIIVAKLNRNGNTAFTTSINKLQSGTNKDNTIRSYFAGIINGTLQVMYLDFEYNYEANDRVPIYGQRAVLKTPVIVSVHNDGSQTRKALHATGSGNNQGFFLRPCSAFKVSGNEYIIVGIGPEFYKYGRMTF